MKRSVDQLSDEELEQRAATARRRIEWFDTHRLTFPPGVGAAVMGGCVLLAKGAGLALGLALTPVGLVSGCFLGLAALVSCDAAVTQKREKWFADIDGIDREKRMRKMQRLPAFQRSLAETAQRINGIFSAAVARDFHDGTEEKVSVSRPLRFKTPASSQFV